MNSINSSLQARVFFLFGVILALLLTLSISDVSAVPPTPTLTGAHSTMPYQPDFPQSDGSDVMLTAAAYSSASGYLLDAPTNVVRIYTKTKQGVIRIKQGDWCAGTGDRGDVVTDFNIYGLTAAKSSVDLAPTNRGIFEFTTTNTNSALYNAPDSSTPYGVLSTGIGTTKTSTVKGSAASCGSIDMPYTALDSMRVPVDAKGLLAKYAGWYGMEFQGTVRDGGTGWNMYELQVLNTDFSAQNGARISFYDGAGFKFALKAEGGGIPGNPGDYNMGFAPACTLGENQTANPTLFWYDVDAGQPNQPTNPVKAYVYEYDKNGNPTSRNSSDGWANGVFSIDITTGNRQQYSRQISMKGNHQYVLHMSEIYSANGIQFALPYDSFNATGSCPPPRGNLTLTCTPSKRYNVSGIADADDGTLAREYRITYGGTNTVDRFTDGGNTVVASGSVYGSASGGLSIVDNRTYYLQVQDDNGAWFNTDSASINCSVPPPGGTGTSTSRCNTTTVMTPNRYNPFTDLNGDGIDDSPTTYPAQAKVTVKDDYNRSLIGSPSPYTVPNDTTKVFRYAPDKTKNVYIHIDQQYVGVSGNPTTYQSKDESFLCFNAKCHIDATGYGPGGIVLAGGNIHITATMENFDPDPDAPEKLDIPLSLDGHNLSVTVNGTEHDIGGSSGIGKGNIGEVPGGFDVPAGSNGQQTITAYTDFYNYGSIGPICTDTVNIYQAFNIKPTASLAGDGENPTAITYTGTGDLTSGPNVDATATTTLTKTGTGTVGAPPAVGHTYGTNQFNDFTYNPPSISNGDEYCPHVTISPANGYVYNGPGGPLFAQPSPATDDGACLVVKNKPYVHFLGADISAGGGFGTNCSTTAGGINTFISQSGVTPPNGSGVQIGALSIGPINGLSSAYLRGSTPIKPLGLSFSNTDNVSAVAANAQALGGNLGGSHCVTDYFSQPKPSSSNAAAANINDNNPSGATMTDTRFYTPNTGSLQLINNSIGNGVNATIFVDGDLEIRNNITYNNTNWPSIEQIPSVRIIVKGNIYIDQSVTLLDGLYIAQPKDDGSAGAIYTCANGTLGYTAINTNLLTDCKSQLVVNGAFVSKHTYLSRSYGSLRNATSAERYKAGVSKDCTDSGVTSLNDCAAEIFNFSPEMYLLQATGTVPHTGPTTGKYDSITSLSPIL